MYVDTSSIKTKSGKTYKRHLLRTSYREEGKVKHKTIANLSSCTEDEIAALKLALRHKGNLEELTSIESLEVEQGLSVGSVWTLKTIAERLGIVKALGKTRMGVLALWLVCARLIDQGSRLSAVRLAGTHAACDVLGIDENFNEDTLYKVLDWCCENQQEIEDKLFRNRYQDAPPMVYLYDVTSSYLEGDKNELGEYGYNRDGKKGKKQVVIGLLTDQEGFPLSVQVFKGNSTDQSTVWDQIRKLKDRFGAERVTLVGDRGMLKSPQQEALSDEDFHFITAITKPQIAKLLKSGVFQLELFDTQLCEIEVDNIRYILRRNPQRRDEIRSNRDDMIRKVVELVADRNRYLEEHTRAKPEVALGKVKTYISKRKLSTFCIVTLEQRRLSFQIDEEAKKEYEKLDGCYSIKTDLKKKQAGAEEIHNRYKDLALVEQAFGMMKTIFLEERPIFVRKASRTRGHMLVVMLGYMITHYVRRDWKEIDFTIEEGVRELSTISADVVRVAGKKISMIPKPRAAGAKLLEALDIVLPKSILHLGVRVATKKKLPERRQLSK
jgi:transposase